MLSIRTLNCRVTVATRRRSSPTAASAGPTQPSLSYREAPAASTGQSPAPGSGDVPEAAPQAPAATSGGSARGAEPQKVADRVYDMIRDEIRLARLRRGG